VGIRYAKVAIIYRAGHKIAPYKLCEVKVAIYKFAIDENAVLKGRSLNF
tara:strand:+ start:557 stop:703 length:147 start_codon:yes stop_codon:yes gene_type:complete